MMVQSEVMEALSQQMTDYSIVSAPENFVSNSWADRGDWKVSKEWLISAL